MINSNKSPKPFAKFEWLIAWRYLRAKRKEGGVSVMTWISLIGIALAVFALIVTLAVRTGFRDEFVQTMLGANPHAEIHVQHVDSELGIMVSTIESYDTLTDEVKLANGVAYAAPVVDGQAMADANGRTSGVQVLGMTLQDLKHVPSVVSLEGQQGQVDRYNEGVAVGRELARALGVQIGDQITLISPNGLQTAFGTSPRINGYEVTYIFSVGRYDIDRTRIYMPLHDAQEYFNREDLVDRIDIFVDGPEDIDRMTPELLSLGGIGSYVLTWKDQAGNFLRALEMEDNIMFIILSILVLIATMNIVSGLIMLVKNKGSDIGILRTMGLTEQSILRIFFICGASIGVLGTLIGLVFGCLFAIYIDPIFSFIDGILGGNVWDPSIRMLPSLPAKLVLSDVIKAVSLSLGLSFIITYFPARRAARLNPVEALRYG